MGPETRAAAPGFLPTPHPMMPRPFRVVRYRRELADTFTLFLEPADGSREFHFQPGQFNMLYHPGAGEVPISISGDPEKPGQLVHTIRAVGNVTKLLQNYRTGDIIGIPRPLWHSLAGNRGRGSEISLLWPAAWDWPPCGRLSTRFSLIVSSMAILN